MLGELQILTLLGLKGVGPRTVQALLTHGSSGDTVDGLFTDLSKLLPPRSLPNITTLRKSWIEAVDLIAKSADRGISCIGYWNQHFPPQLRNIPKPPVILFIQGSITAPARFSVAVIGTRHPTTYGITAATRIAHTLSDNNVVVVSGLAEGCDTAAHEGCLNGNGITIAVLAHGHGVIYPKSNHRLAERILATGGCLLTEYPPDSPPIKNRFVERDRLQSGLSKGIIVIETDTVGGTMHTVQFAQNQHRQLAAIDHPLKWQSDKSRGNRVLIETKVATPIADKAGLLQYIQKLSQSPDPREDSSCDSERQLGLFKKCPENNI